MRWAIAACSACALVAILAGRDSSLGWVALCAEPLAALLGFTAAGALNGRRSPTA